MEAWPLELSDFASVKSFVDRFDKDGGDLDLLVQNAGVALSAYSVTKDGYPLPAPPSFSPHTGRDYADARRGSASSTAGNREVKEQVVGQTRRLAHLMSEQKRRE